jgi:uncharacterized protein (TIGR03118 family)
MLLLMIMVWMSGAAFGQRYSQTNLVSDIQGLAANTDANLVNPWGIAFSSTSPFWVADNGKGVSTIYDGTGAQPFPLVVIIPPPTGSNATSAPTGAVFNGTGDFVISENGLSGPAIFIFVTEDGTISGWNPNVDLTHAVLAVDNSVRGTVYKGLAMGQTSQGKNLLFATNFHDNVIEVYDTNFRLVNTFTDNSVPPRYAPFGIRKIGGKLYVTFAEQNKAMHDDVRGPNHGFVDVVNPDDDTTQRLISKQGLNSPWGLAVAPGDFGKFSNDLLVGNFGDGTISAFDPSSGALLGGVLDANGKTLSINGLWSITFGNGANASQPLNELFFSAGINDEADGLFGKLTAIQ